MGVVRVILRSTEALLGILAVLPVLAVVLEQRNRKARWSTSTSDVAEQPTCGGFWCPRPVATM